MNWEFPQMNVRHQTTDLQSSENTKQDSAKTTNEQTMNTTPRHIIFKLQEILGKENIFWKEPEGGKGLKGAKIRITTDFSETRQIRKEWSEILKMFRQNNNNNNKTTTA